MYKYILFDLDGTLTDPALGITNSVMYALQKYNIEVADRSELYKFIGPPLKDSFMKYYGFNEARAMDAIYFYREYFQPKGLYENEVYENIPMVLETLKNQGFRLILATSKPDEFATEILRHFDLLKYFDFVGGASMDELRSTKIQVLEYIFEHLNIKDKNQAIMVGDREYDVLGAYQMGIDSIGVLYGYGTFEELSTAGATYFAQTPDGILKILLQ